MTELNPLNSLERNSLLVVAAVYEREIAASLERVWENVYDWEHLPWVHSEAFDSIEEIDSGDWGWRALVELAGGSKAEIELITDRDAGHYVARTVDGAGTPSEIWTSLDPIASDRTAIRVEFCVEPRPADALQNLGRGYVSLYTMLWNQDEAMMQTREYALVELRAKQPERPGDSSMSLGQIEDIRPRLPLLFEFDERRFRIVDLDGALVAHSAQCAHLLGPLDDCNVENGVILCPWHGYEFDVRTGKSADGRSLRLRPAPRIVVDSSSGEVTVEALRDGERAPSMISG